MKISALIDSLKTVTKDFPEAEFELGYCSCCIYIEVDGRRIAVLNVDEDRFEYLKQYPPPFPPDVMEDLQREVKATFNRGKSV